MDSPGQNKKNGTLQMRIPCSSVVVQHGKSSCCGHLRPLCHRVTAKIYRGIRSAMTNYLRMPQLEHRFPYCFEYINMFRQKYLNSFSRRWELEWSTFAWQYGQWFREVGCCRDTLLRGEILARSQSNISKWSQSGNKIKFDWFRTHTGRKVTAATVPTATLPS